MATKRQDFRLYPPRYFVGWLELRRPDGRVSRLEFDNAILVPARTTRAYIYCGDRETPFYGDALGRRSPRGVLIRIQYAISVLDVTKGPVIEKYNHPFAHPCWLTREEDCLMLYAPERAPYALMASYTLNEVMPEAGPSSLPVMQFVG